MGAMLMGMASTAAAVDPGAGVGAPGPGVTRGVGAPGVGVGIRASTSRGAQATSAWAHPESVRQVSVWHRASVSVHQASAWWTRA